MEITIKINGQAVSVEVSYKVYEYLEESNRKAENLFHQKRRHWDMPYIQALEKTPCGH